MTDVRREERLEPSPASPPRSNFGVVVAAAVAVAVAVSVGVAFASRSHPSTREEGFADTSSHSPAATASATASSSPADADPSDPPPTVPAGEHLPVTFGAPGWSCDPPADEKFSCTDGSDWVLVTVRPANQHDAYVNDPDKASPGQYVSDIHDGVFATIVPVPAHSAAQVDQLGNALVWE